MQGRSAKLDAKHMRLRVCGGVSVWETDGCRVSVCSVQRRSATGVCAYVRGGRRTGGHILSDSVDGRAVGVRPCGVSGFIFKPNIRFYD